MNLKDMNNTLLMKRCFICR